jgi:hypothetical protein
MGSTLTGNFLAGAAPGRVYVGHWVATLDYDRKAERMRWFYGADLDHERQEFLEVSGIRYVVYGPHERRLNPGLTDPVNVAPAFTAPGLALYDARTLVALNSTTARIEQP